jgi:hypothetical protein
MLPAHEADPPKTLARSSGPKSSSDCKRSTNAWPTKDAVPYQRFLQPTHALRARRARHVVRDGSDVAEGVTA